jgi:hypothetical protein
MRIALSPCPDSEKNRLKPLRALTFRRRDLGPFDAAARPQPTSRDGSSRRVGACHPGVPDMFGNYVFQEGTVITPTELAMLQRVFNRLCQHRNMPATGPRAEAEAAYLVALFSDGLNTDELLWQAVSDEP